MPGRLIVGTIETQNINFDSDTTGMTIDSSGHILQPTKPAFFAYPSSDFSTGTGAGTTQTFDTTQHNVGGHYSTSTGKFTVPIAGVYLLGCTIAITNTTSVIVYLSAELTINGSVGSNKRYHGGWHEKSSSTNTHAREHFSMSHYLAVGDTVQYSHESNVNVTAMGGQGGRHCNFWGLLLG